MGGKNFLFREIFYFWLPKYISSSICSVVD